MIDADTLRLVITGVLSAFGGGGAWSWLSTRHKPRIDSETAEVANAKDATEMALAIAERADGRSQRVEDRLENLEIRLGRWVAFGHDLVVRWPLHRQSETPPPLPE